MVTIHSAPCSILGRKCLAFFQPFVSAGRWQFVCDFHVGGFLQTCVGDSKASLETSGFKEFGGILRKDWPLWPNHLEGLEFHSPESLSLLSARNIERRGWKFVVHVWVEVWEASKLFYTSWFYLLRRCNTSINFLKGILTKGIGREGWTPICTGLAGSVAILRGFRRTWNHKWVMGPTPWWHTTGARPFQLYIVHAMDKWNLVVFRIVFNYKSLRTVLQWCLRCEFLQSLPDDSWAPHLKATVMGRIKLLRFRTWQEPIIPGVRWICSEKSRQAQYWICFGLPGGGRRNARAPWKKMVSLTHDLKRPHGEMEDLEDPLFLKHFPGKIFQDIRRILEARFQIVYAKFEGTSPCLWLHQFSPKKNGQTIKTSAGTK